MGIFAIKPLATGCLEDQLAADNDYSSLITDKPTFLVLCKIILDTGLFKMNLETIGPTWKDWKWSYGKSIFSLPS
jgi:hypothetical protein